MEAQFNVMQAVFTVMQSFSSEPSESHVTLSLAILDRLLKTVFNEKMEVGKCYCVYFKP